MRGRRRHPHPYAGELGIENRVSSCFSQQLTRAGGTCADSQDRRERRWRKIEVLAERRRSRRSVTHQRSASVAELKLLLSAGSQGQLSAVLGDERPVGVEPVRGAGARGGRRGARRCRLLRRAGFDMADADRLTFGRSGVAVAWQRGPSTDDRGFERLIESSVRCRYALATSPAARCGYTGSKPS